MQNNLFRIALIGPESTGKTTLCKELAEHFRTSWVPEYAREFMNRLERHYTFEDLIYCAEKQLELEELSQKNASKIVFSDTEFIIFKVWFIDSFGKCPEWIEKTIDEKKYDLYLLTSPDLPFIEDPVRENPTRREYFFDWYKSELVKRKLPFKIINGRGKSRLENAIRFVKELIMISAK